MTTASTIRRISGEMSVGDLLERLAAHVNSELPAGYEGSYRLDEAAQLSELRACLPPRRMGLREGMILAERQASLLRWQLGAEAKAGIDTDMLARLPFVRSVTYRATLPKSGLTTKTDSGWVIVLRDDEPIVRQRFSLCHEIKHILDDEAVGRFPDGLYRSIDEEAEASAERICDHFAACLLMPRILLRRDWTSGLQDVSRLAKRYHVSKPAMEIRLRTLGLRAPIPRCAYPPDPD